MAQTIKLKRSAVAGRIPTTSDLDLGEVAINTYDGKMYMKKNVSGVESIVEVTSAQLPTDPTFDSVTLTGAPGPIEWNSLEDTVDIPLNSDVTLQVGQESVFRAKATEAISNGDVVMFAGAQGDHLLVAKADMSAVGFEPEYVIGIATQDFLANDFGFVTTFGKVRGLNTAALSEGDILYLDPSVAGGLTATKPTSPDHVIQMCAVVRSHLTQGTYLVRPTHMPDSDEIPEGASNLYFTNQRVFDAADSRYVNVAGDTMTGNLEVSGQVTTGYGVRFNNGNTSFLQYNNVGENVLYMRDMTNGQMLTTWYTNRFLVNKNLEVSGTTTLNSTTVIQSTSPVLILKDTDSTGAGQSGFISLRDSGDIERGWMGYGSSSNTDFTVRNSQGKIRLDASHTYIPTLDLAISSSNSDHGAGTYFRGSNSHFVLGLSAGNTLYLNYGNSAGNLRLYGNIYYENTLTLNSARDLLSLRNATFSGTVTANNFVGSIDYSQITNPPVIDNSVDYINSASFNTSNGVLTLSGVGRAGATVNLDNRYLTSYSETDTLQSVTNRGNTTNQDIIISKTSARLRLHEPNSSDQNYPSLEFDTDNAQGVALSFNEFDSQLPLGGYGLVLGPSTTNAQFPTTGQISLNVLGEIYAGGTTLSSLHRVWHAGNFTPSDYLLTSNYEDNYVDSVAFNTSTGVLTLGRTGSLSDLTVDLDGKYAESSHVHSQYMPIQYNTPYTIPSATTWGSYNLANGTMMQASGVGRPDGSTHGYWHVIGKRDVVGGYAGLYVNNYQDAGSGLWLGRNDSGTDAPVWEKIWTDKTLNPVTGLAHDTVNTELDVTFADGTTQSLDLSQYIDDTNLSRIVSGAHVGSGIVRFTRDDSTTFDVDFSDFFDDTNLARIVSASWNTSNGVLTLTRNDSSTVTVDLDGRYYNTGESDGRYVLKTGDTMTGSLTVPGVLKVTETGTAQQLLIGNQDSGGVNKPGMIRGVNGMLQLGHGTSWLGEGGTLTNAITIKGGRVSIKNDNPYYDLDISKREVYDTPTIRLGVQNGDAAGTSNTFGGSLVFAPNWNSYTKRSAGIAQIAEGNYFRSGLAFYTNNAASATTDWSERMRLDMDGNLGVNVPEPETILHIKKIDSSTTNRTNSVNSFIIETDNNNIPYTGFGGEILFKNRAYNSGIVSSASIGGLINNDSTQNNGGSLVFKTAPDVSTSPIQRMLINYNGNVGINTLNPNAKLDVNGDFHADLTSLNGAGYDFNDFARVGFYNLYNTGASSNAPPFNFGSMLVLGSAKAAATFATQIAHERLNNGLYIRGMNDTGSTWSSWQRVFMDNYHPNADKWTTARTNTVTLTGDVTGSGSASVDGTGNWTVNVSTTVANNSHDHNYLDGTQISSLDSAWQLRGTSENIGIMPLRYQSGATNEPVTGNNANWGLNIFSHAGSSGNYPYGRQLAGTDNEDIYTRKVSNGAFGAWRKIWHSGHFNISDYDTRTVSDSRYVKVTGDTMTGSLTMGPGTKIHLDSVGQEITFGQTPGQVGYIRQDVAGQIQIGSDNEIAFYETDANTQSVLIETNTGNINANGTITAASFVGSINYSQITNPPVIDNSVDYINAASFNTSTGVLTLSGVGRAGATVDLDNRYLTGYTETDTLATVCARGNTTSSTVTVGNLRVGASNTENYIAFRGTTGDQPGSFNHGYIGEHIYSGSEVSELLLFKGNDVPGSGPDRIRHFAAEHAFDTYTVATSGTFDSVASSANAIRRMTISYDGITTLNSGTWSNTLGAGLRLENNNSVGAGITLKPTASASYSAGWSLYAGAASAAIGDGSFGIWNNTASDFRLKLTQEGSLELPDAGLVVGRTSTAPAIDIPGQPGASSYNFILRGANDTGNKAVHFVNGSTRSADWGANAYVIRNDGGRLVLGKSNYETVIEGSQLTLTSGANIYSDRANSTGDSIKLINVRSSTWAFNFTTNSSTGDNNWSGFWVNSDGMPDMRLRDLDDDVRVKFEASTGRSSYIDAGNFGVGIRTPGAKFHVRKADVTSYIDNYSTAVFEDTEARLQLCSSNSGTNAAAVTLSNENHHWSMHHRGSSSSNVLSFGYANTTSSTDIVNSTMTGIVMQLSTAGVNVNGLLTATQKSFTIDHPTKEGHKLRYGSLEGPENGVYVRGRLKGTNTIELPEYWKELVHEDSITVNLTPIGKGQDIWVEDFNTTEIVVGGENVNCFYTVYGERKDVEKLITEFKEVE